MRDVSAHNHCALTQPGHGILAALCVGTANTITDISIIGNGLLIHLIGVKSVLARYVSTSLTFVNECPRGGGGGGTGILVLYTCMTRGFQNIP